MNCPRCKEKLRIVYRLGIKCGYCRKCDEAFSEDYIKEKFGGEQ